MGELNYFLELQVKETPKGVFISQSKFALNLVKKFNLDSFKVIRIPMGLQDKLTKNSNEIPIDKKLYRNMIGSLLYLTTNRPDISFRTYVCARFQVDPK